MKLNYRGVNYEREPATIEYGEGEIGGHYRGQDWYYRYPKHIPQLRPKLYRQYRGVSYSTQCGTRSAPQSIPLAKNSSVGEGEVACPVSLSRPRKVYIDQTTQVHLDNIRRNLERRLAVAKANGDKTLISLLEKESKEFAFTN